MDDLQAWMPDVWRQTFTEPCLRLVVRHGRGHSAHITVLAASGLELMMSGSIRAGEAVLAFPGVQDGANYRDPTLEELARVFPVTVVVS